MRTYIVFGKDQTEVGDVANQFANQNNGNVGPVETRDHIRCDNIANNTSVDSGAGGPNFMCRVDY